MMKKMKNKKGFTLMEMLIVVAIIAVLIVIAIPTFNNALAKSRAAADLANIRSGYASAQVKGMMEDITDTTDGDTYYLQKDGSIAASSDNDYECQGGAGGVDADTTIGGVTTAGTLNWEKGNKITYTLTENATTGEINVAIGVE